MIDGLVRHQSISSNVGGIANNSALQVAISDLEISLVFPRSMTLVYMNVRLSGDSSP